MVNITFFVAVSITVIPSRSVTTPPKMMSSLTPIISQSPTTGESSDDELSTGAAVSIIVGALFVMFAGAVVIIGIFIRLVDTICTV